MRLLCRLMIKIVFIFLCLEGQSNILNRSVSAYKLDRKAKIVKNRSIKSDPKTVYGTKYFRTKACIIYDVKNSRILYSKNEDTLAYPASLTKIMTLYAACKAIQAGYVSLETILTVSRYAANQPPSKLGLSAGEKIYLGDALNAMMTISSNDAAQAIMERLFRKDFIQIYSGYMRDFGMNSTILVNPHGLPDRRNITCASDLLRLTLQIVRHYSHLLKFSQKKRCCYKGYCRENSNKLLGEIGVIGVKTGYVFLSGFQLITYSKINNSELIGVFLGADSSAERFRYARKMLEKYHGLNSLSYSFKYSSLAKQACEKNIKLNPAIRKSSSRSVSKNSFENFVSQISLSTPKKMVKMESKPVKSDIKPKSVAKKGKAIISAKKVIKSVPAKKAMPAKKVVSVKNKSALDNFLKTDEVLRKIRSKK